MEIVAKLNFLLNLFIACAWIFGWYILFADVLSSFAAYIEERIGHKWMKPLFACPPCMASVHGTGMFFVLFSEYHLGTYLIFILALAGLNYILTQLIWD